MSARTPTPVSPEVPLVEASGLVLSYGSTIAMAESSFTLPQGGVTAIIGPNGSGKSTLLHAIAGILPPSGGRLAVFGGPTSESWQRCAYVMQTVQLTPGTPLTVREVVGMGRYPALGWFRAMQRRDRERVRDAMAQLEITDLADRQLGELSGGQRQRVYVAQGLAQDHEAVLLDEPLTGLDLVSARAIDRIIHSEKEVGHSVVLTTHDLVEARAADNVILMSGRVVAAGPPQAVLTRTNLEDAYGLGALHEWDTDTPFLDDPADPHPHT